MFQVQGDAEQPIRFLMMIAKLVDSQSSQDKYRRYTSGKGSAYIRDAITNEYRITHIDSKLIACLE